MSDHERVTITSSSASCGIFELSRLADDPEAVAYAIGSRLYHPSRGDPVGYLMWSDTFSHQSVNSDTFAKFVTKNKLGQVQWISPCENPRTGNMIRIGVCLIDHDIWKRWYKETRVKKLGKVGR